MCDQACLITSTPNRVFNSISTNLRKSLDILIWLVGLPMIDLRRKLDIEKFLLLMEDAVENRGPCGKQALLMMPEF